MPTPQPYFKMATPSYNIDDKTFLTVAAREYADHVWEETLNKQEWITYSAFGGEILLELAETVEQRSEVQNDEVEAWKQGFETEMKELESRAEDLIIIGIGFREAYQKSRLLSNLMVIEPPSYLIDIMQPPSILNIQRKYDVAREARHLSTKIIDPEDVLMYRTRPGRCYYIDSPHMTPDINVDAEVAELTTLRDHGNIEELKTWLPANVAAFVDRDCSGFKKHGGKDFWDKHQVHLGNFTALTSMIFPPGYYQSCWKATIPVLAQDPLTTLRTLDRNTTALALSPPCQLPPNVGNASFPPEYPAQPTNNQFPTLERLPQSPTTPTKRRQRVKTFAVPPVALTKFPNPKEAIAGQGNGARKAISTENGMNEVKDSSQESSLRQSGTMNTGVEHTGKGIHHEDQIVDGGDSSYEDMTEVQNFVRRSGRAKRAIVKKV